MSHAWMPDVEFFLSLCRADEKLAEDERRKGCPCGGLLHRSDYPRKPRGIPPEVENEFARRISFCCCREGCRRRRTPPSVRFAGRRLYVAAIVLWTCAVEEVAPAPVPRPTVRRWRDYWQRLLVASAFWLSHRAQLPPDFDQSRLPASLLEAFVAPSPPEQLRRTLHWLRLLWAPGFAARKSRDRENPQRLTAAGGQPPS